MPEDPQHVTLRDYLQRQIDDMDRRVAESLAAHDRRGQQQFSAAQEAVDKAERTMSARLELLNEFRAQQADESKKYMSRDLYDREHANLAARVTAVEMTAGTLQGRALAFAGMAAIIGSIVGAILVAVITHSL